MLLPNQRKVIEDAVTHGETLPASMASALLAALQEAEISWKRISVHLQVERASVARLECERDEILALKRETQELKQQVEKVIDERVDTRTTDLRGYLEIATAAKEKAENSYRVVDKALEDVQDKFHLLEQNYQGIILRMEKLLEEKMSPTLISRFTWNRKAKNVLEDVSFLKIEATGLADEKKGNDCSMRCEKRMADN